MRLELAGEALLAMLVAERLAFAHLDGDLESRSDRIP